MLRQLREWWTQYNCEHKNLKTISKHIVVTAKKNTLTPLILKPEMYEQCKDCKKLFRLYRVDN